MEKLEEKDAGEYSIEIEFFDQEKKKIFGAGAKTKMFIQMPSKPEEKLKKIEEIEKPEESKF